MSRLGAALLFAAAVSLAAEDAPAPQTPPLATQVRVYTPMTAEERWDDYLHRSFSWEATAERVGRNAVLNTWSNNPPEWDGMGGYGKRVASDFSRSWIRRGMESAGAAAIGHDPRYIPCPCENPWKRIAHAMSQTLLTYDNDGKRVFGYARVGSRYAASMIETQWFPERYGWKDGLREGTQSMVSVSVYNVAREFWPDIKRKLKWGKK